MPRDPKDISVSGTERNARRLGEFNDAKDPIRLRVGAGPAGDEGKEGPKGEKGETGTPGADGENGKNGGFNYLFNTSTAESDPGTGKLKLNSATLSSVTRFRISETDNDGNGLAAFLATWDDSTTTTARGYIILRSVGTASDFAVYLITAAISDKGTWDQFTVSHVSSGGTFSNEEAVTVEFSRTGNIGATGEKGPAGAGLPEGVTDYGKVTELPGSPSDGDRCTFSTGGVRWKLEYDSSTGYWYKIGGPPLYDEDDTSRATSSKTFVSLTSPLSITAPLEGDYDVRQSATMVTGAGGEHPYLSHTVGETAASTAWSAHNFVSGSTINLTVDGADKRHTGVAKSATIIEKALSSFGTSSSFANRRLWIDPIRVK